MRRLSWWLAGCRPTLLLALVSLVALGALARAQDDVMPAAVGMAGTVDPVGYAVGQLGYPGVLAVLGWRALGIVERVVALWERAWPTIERDGVRFRHEVRHRGGAPRAAESPELDEEGTEPS